MGRAYTKEEIVGAAVHRFRAASQHYESLGEPDRVYLPAIEKMFNEHYDKVGKDEFRKHASVTADTMKEYFLWQN